MKVLKSTTYIDLAEKLYRYREERKALESREEELRALFGSILKYDRKAIVGQYEVELVQKMRTDINKIWLRDFLGEKYSDFETHKMYDSLNIKKIKGE